MVIKVKSNLALELLMGNTPIQRDDDEPSKDQLEGFKIKAENALINQ